MLVGSLLQELPSIDLIMAVDNTKEFHEENLSRNKTHYTYFIRSTKGKLVHKIQDMAARVHFNHTKLTASEHIKELSNGEASQVQIRYGIISLDDMLRDLQHWETLLTSSFMQRPFEVLERGGRYEEVQQMQM